MTWLHDVISTSGPLLVDAQPHLHFLPTAVPAIVSIHAGGIALRTGNGGRHSNSGGSVLQRGATVAVPGTGVRAVLEGTGGGRWRVITGHPTP